MFPPWPNDSSSRCLLRANLCGLWRPAVSGPRDAGIEASFTVSILIPGQHWLLRFVRHFNGNPGQSSMFSEWSQRSPTPDASRSIAHWLLRVETASCLGLSPGYPSAPCGDTSPSLSPAASSRSDRVFTMLLNLRMSSLGCWHGWPWNRVMCSAPIHRILTHFVKCVRTLRPQNYEIARQ